MIFDHSHIHRIAELDPQAAILNVFHDNFQDYRRCPVVLSEGQRALLPPTFERAPVVHNAIDVSAFPFSPFPVDPPFAFFCGALSEIKHPLLAIEACARMGLKLVMAGQSIVGKFPVTDVENVEYVGAIPPHIRNQYMMRARVFLQLGDVESFGLTTLEAGACGCPVVAFASGGNVDTVANGVNGVFIPAYGRDKVGAVCDAIESAWYLDRRACREHVAGTFSLARQLDAYEHLLGKCAVGDWWG